ncbi:MULTISPECIES: hypothetical protein [unclassified Halorubrum]|uniref:hypothetical protein n=1 Tax=unclassified Halorubrum TaxID=2642239 RepID=UPI001F53953B|nr:MULTISPECIES: hypothetical protein [unclassified Halorubrum]
MALQWTVRQYLDSASRRRFLACSGGVLIAGTAGCTGIVNSLADLALGDVNLFNETDDTLTGTVTITDSADETVLSDAFELPPASGDEDADEKDDEDGMTAYEDVWTDSRAYDARVELDDDPAIQVESATSSSITIDNPSEEMLAIVFGGEEFDDTIGFTVGESLSDLAQA